jgi:hypothetical protein
MAEALNQAGSHTGVRICTLKYRKPDSGIDSDAGEVIFLAVKSAHSLKLYTRRDLTQLISGRDRAFVRDLLNDMVQRAEDSPDELFEQLSNLSVGPVVTDGVKSIANPEAGIEALYEGFCAARVS